MNRRTRSGGLGRSLASARRSPRAQLRLGSEAQAASVSRSATSASLRSIEFPLPPQAQLDRHRAAKLRPVNVAGETGSSEAPFRGAGDAV